MATRFLKRTRVSPTIPKASIIIVIVTATISIFIEMIIALILILSLGPETFELGAVSGLQGS